MEGGERGRGRRGEEGEKGERGGGEKERQRVRGGERGTGRPVYDLEHAPALHKLHHDPCTSARRRAAGASEWRAAQAIAEAKRPVQRMRRQVTRRAHHLLAHLASRRRSRTQGT
eukprot:691316-Rhodomonas_salina.2